jgi:hypothetical protein
VEPGGPLPTGSQTVTLTGQGFDATGNDGKGIYVVYGPITAAPGFYTDPSIYAAFKWVYPGSADSPATAPMTPDGSFTTTLDIASSFSGPAGPVDCSVVACAVITFGAHGSQDRSQDTCTVVTFEAGLASPALATSLPSPAQVGAGSPAPGTSTAPGASAVPADACAPITGGATAP